jgi:hypothetical protein
VLDPISAPSGAAIDAGALWIQTGGAAASLKFKATNGTVYTVTAT